MCSSIVMAEKAVMEAMAKRASAVAKDTEGPMLLNTVMPLLELPDFRVVTVVEGHQVPTEEMPATWVEGEVQAVSTDRRVLEGEVALEVMDAHGMSHTSYHSTHHSRPPAPPGPDGPPGYPPNEPIYGGNGGSNGSCQIRVLRKDLTEGTYTSRYRLIVKSFDVIDENEDGINEPGEYLHVKNIVVENTGGMPSPKGNILKVLVQPTSWLEPVAAEPLELPREIQPGATVRVPGILRAFIKYEFSPRAVGTALCARDTVRLVAFFERLQRRLPEFGGGADVMYRYPLVMSPPKYLDCVAKGDMVRFSWTIKNSSSKAYGSDISRPRAGGTHLKDPNGVFDLTYADPEKPHEVSDFLEVLEPGAKVPITQDFRVSDAIAAFSTGHLLLNLLLSDPHTGTMRPIMSFELSIQISSEYRYNALSRFLLVVNASTPNLAIRHVIDFIENGIHIPIDIFNLSLTGSFANPDTGNNVLDNYHGKSVIIFGNSFNYFQKGNREPWDLLDPWDTCYLAKGGTNFLFINPTNTTSFKNWASQMVLPAYALEAPPDTPTTKAKDIIRQLSTDHVSNEPSTEHFSFPVKKRLFRNLESTLLKQAQSTEKRLSKKLPLRRFLTAPCDLDSAEGTLGPNLKAKSGAVAIAEGLPHHAKMIASLQPHSNQINSITDYNIALVMHSLPFKDQCAIFWNIVGLDASEGVSTSAAYGGSQLTHFSKDSKTSGQIQEHKIINEKACEALSWSIGAQIMSEISHFSVNTSWPDSSMSKSSISAQLPLLNQFVKSAPSSIHFSSDEGISHLANALGPIIAIAKPLGFSQWLAQSIVRLGNRRTKIRSLVRHQADHLAHALPASDARKHLNRTVNAEVKGSSKRLAQIKKENPAHNRSRRAHALACLRLVDLTGTPQASFLDLGDLSGVQRSVALSREEIAQRRGEHAALLRKREADAEWSGRMIAEMVNPVGGDAEALRGTAAAAVVDGRAQVEDGIEVVWSDS
ncbi:hypothetical protein NKR23_g8697 [Pleurostoma richardsiae]|uniref:DUF7932 domain-containing protein n=1 Tax=Pleurostoma richardsiae TaxID=41990 RepID=A0AA38RHK4_9PEZI|nr:hypothetical protein NKR23_g8697 [Pleurostoma richardsiae]